MIVLSQPEWWLGHADELADALRSAARMPERDEPAQARDDEVVLSHPEWWLDHPDELEAALREAVREREAPEGFIDLDRALRDAEPPRQPEAERDHGIEHER